MTQLKQFFFGIFPLIILLTQPVFALDFNTKNGLSHNGVTSILEDSRGYLWIGTYDGLNRYNGRDFTLYRSSPTHSVLLNNRVRTLAEDALNRIWIGTDRGLMIYDFIENHFVDLSWKSGLYQNNDIVIALDDSRKDRMIALTENGGLATFNTQGELLRFDKLHGFVCNHLLRLSNELYLIATNRGLVQYNYRTGRFKKIEKISQENCIVLSKTSLDSIYAVATRRGVKLIKINQIKDDIVCTLHQTLYDKHSFRTVFCDSQGTLWLGSNQKGIVPIRLDNLEQLPANPFNSTMRTSCFHEGRNQVLWVGSFDQGFISRSLMQNPFHAIDLLDQQSYRTFQFINIDQQKIAIKTTGRYTQYDIATGKKSTFMPQILNNTNGAVLSTRQGWIVAVDKEKQKKIYRLDNPRSLPREMNLIGEQMPVGAVRTITEDAYGNIWISYPSNIFRIHLIDDNNTMQVEKIQLPKLRVSTQNIRNIYSDPKDKSLWIATSINGLYRIVNPNLATKHLHIEQYAHDPQRSQSLSSNFVTAVLRDKSGVLWVGTEHGGLCRVREEKMHFKSYTVENSNLSNNNIKSLICDSQNRLWIATNTGISLFNRTNERFMNYNTQNGIPVDNMGFFATQLPNDVLVFSGIERSFYFNANNIQTDESIPQFQFGRLRIYNQVIEPNDVIDEKILLYSRLKSGDTLRLNYKQNVFSIEIDALHYTDRQNCRMRYKILPINNEWIINNPEQMNIALNGLHHGQYEIHTALSNAYGEWGNTKKIYVIIAPPLWKTWWAYTLYGILFISIVAFVIYSLLKMQRMNYKARIDEIERINMNEKQRYFSNIAHEIKTPLALIVAPVQSLLDTFAHDVGVRSYLQRIEIQSRKMSHLIDVAQSIQSIDAGLLRPQSSVFDFNVFMHSLLEDFVFLASHDNKKIEINAPEEPLIVKSDISMLEKIANNLLNNAMKYTLSNSLIRVSWHSEGNKNLRLSVSDTGMGIDPADIPHIFERYYRGTKHTIQPPSGTGIGLSFSKRLVHLLGGEIGVESIVGEGSTFTVQLPIMSNEQPEELQTQTSDNYIYDDMGALRNMDTSQHPDSLVYVVEDNLEMRLMLERIVGQFYQCETFANGKEALNAMEQKWPDIVVSDVMMPIIDGFELCERVKCDIKTSHIPVILLTACTAFDDRIKGMKYGADLYLAKPFYPKYLITCIETTLVGRAKLRERFKNGMPIQISDARQSDKDNKLLEQFNVLMNDNLDSEDINLDKFARELGVNRTYFFQKIKQLTGRTPFDLIKEIRLSKAAQLLVQEDLSVEDVCVAVGFKSRTHFSKLFKEKFGMSPRQYVISLRKGNS